MPLVGRRLRMPCLAHSRSPVLDVCGVGAGYRDVRFLWTQVPSQKRNVPFGTSGNIYLRQTQSYPLSLMPRQRRCTRLSVPE